MLVSPDDPQSLIFAAECLMNNSRLCVEYGDNGRAHAERTFEIRAIADTFLSAYGPLSHR